MTDSQDTDTDRHEVRYDPVHGWPVIYAPPRARRPLTLNSREESKATSDNPFAAGNEAQTMPERFALRQEGSCPDQPGWQVRVFPNKYPVLYDPEHSSDDAAIGYHEVIVESPEPVSHVADLPQEQFRAIFQAYRIRLGQIAEEGRYEHVTIFKNQGQPAGASQPHVHSQLMATHFVPPMLDSEWRHCLGHHERTGQSWFGTLIDRERSSGDRIVLETPRALLFCPYASRFAFEMHLVPGIEQSHFHHAEDSLLQAAADLMKEALVRLQRVSGASDFNYVLHTAPLSAPATSPFRWHWEIYPRLAGIAGWELGQGGYVNPLPPERAAELLRAART